MSATSAVADSSTASASTPASQIVDAVGTELGIDIGDTEPSTARERKLYELINEWLDDGIDPEMLDIVVGLVAGHVGPDASLEEILEATWMFLRMSGGIKKNG